MNAERLHAIAKAVLREITRTKSRETLTSLVQSLDASVSSPAEATYQQQVSEHREALRAALVSAGSNQFSPAWRQALRELGLSELLGSELLARIEEIFNRNQITQSVARDELQQLSADLDAAATALDQLTQGMSGLNLGWDELGPGEVELGILIPRAFVHNELGGLAKELDQLRKLLTPIIELATGSGPEIDVKTISSSDFSFVLDIGPEALDLLSHALAYLVGNYKQILEIRKLKEEMQRLDMPSNTIDEVDEEATNRVNEKIGELVTELLNDHEENLRGDGRPHEVRVQLTKSLEGLALRIDQGFNFDVRAEPPELEAPSEEEDGEGGGITEEQQAQLDRYQRIIDAMPELQYMQLDGDPVLALEDPNMDADGDEAVEGEGPSGRQDG